ncbi:MAG TPA: YggS family pyridoxal phosphate-dependent enzyme [Gemmatimonadales bacterium]|nr:YggS family pyridoxal phosphate-dependent enzyme [Gemmatimonadales bacterium]
MEFPALPARLAQVRATIAERQARGGWTHPVRIVAVTKTHGPEAVRAAVAAGLDAVGENRVQEALPKQDATADVAVDWHLIGSLQRNKVRQVIGRFALIHAVDRWELAEEFQKRVPAGAVQGVLVQVNCSGEPQKGGVEPEGAVELLDRLRGCDRLEVRGLMTMAELTGDERVQRAAFRRLREVQEAGRRAGHALPELSMGMSGDYGVAVEEGATLVRLGTILFGERER